MDKFRLHSSKVVMTYDIFDSNTSGDSKVKSKEKHLLRKLSRRRLKEDIVEELKEIERQKNIDISGF